MGKYKILTFDGGGIRGLLTAKLLQMLSDAVPGMLKNIKLYAGTSTGGIITLGLAYGLTPAQIVDLYLKNGAEIFDPFEVKFYEKFARGINKPKYNNVRLKELLEKTFPKNPPLKSLRAKVLINALKLNCNNNWQPVHITNYKHSEYLDVPIVDAALRTSAAPVYFPSYQGFIDGGVFANNPSTIALSTALDKQSGKARLNSIRLLSFGTGFFPACIAKEDVMWGAMEWLDPFGHPPTPLLSVLMNGSQTVDDYQCRQILGEKKYYRVNLQFDKHIELDNWEEAGYLTECAESFPSKYPEQWGKIKRWVKKNFV